VTLLLTYLMQNPVKERIVKLREEIAQIIMKRTDCICGVAQKRYRGAAGIMNVAFNDCMMAPLALVRTGRPWVNECYGDFATITLGRLEPRGKPSKKGRFR
jgi:hypothetical protein